MLKAKEAKRFLGLYGMSQLQPGYLIILKATCLS